MRSVLENEACYQVTLLMRREPRRWKELFALQDAGLSWADILAAMQHKKQQIADAAD
jgi:hypothetical protein